MSSLNVSIHGSTAELNERRWNTLIEQSQLGSCFHRTEWLAAVEDGLQLDPYHITVEHDGNFIAVCPNFVSDLRLPEAVSFPGVRYFREVASTSPGFGGPVIASQERNVLKAITDAINTATGPGVLSHYLRTGDAGYGRYAQAFDVLGYTPSVLNCRFVIDLSKDKEEIVADMDRSRRRSLRKAREIDADVHTVSLDRETIEAFHERYERVMERVGGQAYPRSFFFALLRHLEDRTLAFGVDIDGRNVGQHLCLCDEEQSSLHYLFSAVEEENFQYYPSELMHDAAIDWALEAGYDSYDFGETGADFDDGLFKYKEQFGGRLVPVITWERGLSPLWPVYEFGRSVYRRSSSEYTDSPIDSLLNVSG